MKLFSLIMNYKLKQSLKIENWPFWIGLLLIFTVIHFTINLYFLGFSWENIFMLGGDAEQYIGSSENLLKNGEFTWYLTQYYKRVFPELPERILL